MTFLVLTGAASFVILPLVIAPRSFDSVFDTIRYQQVQADIFLVVRMTAAAVHQEKAIEAAIQKQRIREAAKERAAAQSVLQSEEKGKKHATRARSSTPTMGLRSIFL